MKEYGGFFELEDIYKEEYHKLLDFNCARNALRYLIRKKSIKKLYLPKLNCYVIREAVLKENVEIIEYDLDDNFKPKLEKTDDFVYIVNVYGLISINDLKKLNQKFKHMIIDNTHDFFSKSLKEAYTIYNCRKYFGVPDGAYLSSPDIHDNNELNRETTKDLCKHLLGRFETKSAFSYYDEFKKYDNYFMTADIKRMSLISKNILGAIDYKKIKQIRINNFKYLDKKLSKFNNLRNNHEITFMYPLNIKNGNELRNYLVENKVYVPILWPNVLKECDKDSFEYKFVNDTVLLPIDQRYDFEDLNNILSIIERWILNEKN